MNTKLTRAEARDKAHDAWEAYKEARDKADYALKAYNKAYKEADEVYEARKEENL